MTPNQWTPYIRTKPCAACGATMTQRRGESIPRWSKRRYCSHTCANTKECECGRPVDHVVAGIRLCGNCFVEMIVEGIN